jgi:hypothetical protein
MNRRRIVRWLFSLGAVPASAQVISVFPPQIPTTSKDTSHLCPVCGFANFAPGLDMLLVGDDGKPVTMTNAVVLACNKCRNLYVGSRPMYTQTQIPQQQQQ